MATSIISQPPAGSLQFAYRPVVFRVQAIQDDATAERFIPPVVFCDIYVNGVYYKSTHKTHYINKPEYGVVDAVFEFDIQDACQEVLKPVLPAIGLNVITQVQGLVAEISCKFREGSVNDDGFVYFVDIAPVQATGGMNAVAGSGTVSNVFSVVNATIEHEDFQTFEEFLSTFKNGQWSSDSLPLSPRPNSYRLCSRDNDTFPILYKGIKNLKCIKVNYRLKGSSEIISEQYCVTVPVCTPVGFVGEPDVPDANVGEVYELNITLTGTGPYLLNTADSSYPAWWTVTIRGNKLKIFGVPTSANVGEDIPFTIKVDNACGSATLSETINVVEPVVCVPVTIGLTLLTDAVEGSPFSATINLSGTAPFGALTSVIKPAWATVALVGSTVQITGTPTAPATDVLFQFTVSNCSGATATFSQLINVASSGTPENFTIENNSISGVITSVTPLFYLVYSGSFPIAATEALLGFKGAWNTKINVTVSSIAGTHQLNLYKNGVMVESKNISSSGTYALNFSNPINFSTTDSLKIELTA